MNFYVQHIGLTVWRKKIAFLIAAGLLVLLTLGLQFSHEQEKATNTRVIKVTGEYNQFANLKTSIDTKTITTLDELAMRKAAAENEKAQQGLEKQLGIPFVNLDAEKPYVPKRRIVHLDLKGAPLKINFLKKAFALIKGLGATGILIEYEDMFPYNGLLKDLAAKNAYTTEQITQILSYASDLNLDVIPLIQTFGHMEFVLKYATWRQLREVPDSPQAVCPSRNGSLELIKEMVTQIMALHPKINYLHIGCDEVFQMGECEMCRLELHENLFLKHTRNVAKLVHSKWPHLRLIIWDDMLRHISQQNIQDFSLGDLVEPMVWVYAEDIYRFVQSPVWDKYAAVFKTAWTASAFKGAFGETLYIPDARRHLENNLRWLDVMSQQNQLFKKGLAGIALTGWQRYDHFAVLCELFPAALPSLALSLLAVSHGFFNLSLRASLLSALSCPEHTSIGRPVPFITLETDKYLWDKLGRCMFPGSPIFRLMYRLRNTENEVLEYLKMTQLQRGWLTRYNIKHNYSLPLRVDELTADLPRIYHGLLALSRAAYDTMNEVFDYYTVAEWIEQRIYPYIYELEKIQNQSLVLKSVNTWSSRPIPPLKDLQRLGIPLPDD